jgi:hypothetical protein
VTWEGKWVPKQPQTPRCCPLEATLRTFSWMTRHQKNTPTIYRVSNPFHDPCTATYRSLEDDFSQAPSWAARPLLPRGPVGCEGYQITQHS